MSAAIRHGTRYGYREQGCRCDDCRTARRADDARRRARPIPPDMPHGVIGTYRNYGCRCEPCRGAQAARMAAYYRERVVGAGRHVATREARQKVPPEVARQAAILARCVPDDFGCWIWMAATSRDGRGSFGDTTAARFAYIAFVGPVPDDIELDHICENARCVNPDHLDPVTHAENIRRRSRSYVWCAALLAELAEDYAAPRGSRSHQRS